MSLEVVTRESLGLYMRRARQERGWSLEGASRRVGIPVPVLGSYERAQRNPSLGNTVAWVGAFDRRIVVLDPSDIVVGADTAGEQYVTFHVVSAAGVVLDQLSRAAAESLARQIRGSKVGYRVHRRGPMEFGYFAGEF